MRPDELQELVDTAPLHRLLRLHVANAGKDWLTLRSEPASEHLVDPAEGYLHGGIVATLLDAAATFALIQATSVDWSTVDLRVDFLRPAPAAPLLARGTAVQVGRRLGRATAELSEEGSGRLLATAAGTFMRTVAQAAEGSAGAAGSGGPAPGERS
jgi:uncharacterized protein (TIGR00369 family)